MIIDDNDADRMIAKRICRRSGLVDRVVDFATALEALAYLGTDTNEPFDLILLDQNMPNMDGVGFLQNAADRLASKLEHTDVIMLSTLLSDHHKTETEQFSFVKGSVAKPLTEKKLVALLPGSDLPV